MVGSGCGAFAAGLVAYPLLPVAPLPQVDFPTIQVSASLPGASPETMASTVAVFIPQGCTQNQASCMLRQMALRWAEHAQKIGDERVWSETAKRFHQMFKSACWGRTHVA